MASVNKVILVGNVGKDPELRYTPNGSAVCSLSVATVNKWNDKESGEKKEETEWHQVAFYGRIAEIAGEYLNKGSQAYIEGRLKTRKWKDKDGADRYTTEVIAENLQLIGGRPGAEDKPQSKQPEQRQPARQAPKRRQSSTGFDDMDDDIPF